MSQPTGYDEFMYMQYGDTLDSMPSNAIFTIPNHDVIMTSQNGRFASPKQHRGVPMTSNNCHVDQTVSMIRLNYAIFREIRKITAKMKNDAEEENLKFVWNKAAKILDRFFLIIFIMINIAAAIVIFGIVHQKK